MIAAVGAVTRTPEHCQPDDRDEAELGEDDRDLSEVGELRQDPLHRCPLLCL